MMQGKRNTYQPFHRQTQSGCLQWLFRVGDQCSVEMIVSPPELQKHFFYAEGPISNCERAKEALHKRSKELEDEPEDK